MEGGAEDSAESVSELWSLEFGGDSIKMELYGDYKQYSPSS